MGSPEYELGRREGNDDMQEDTQHWVTIDKPFCLGETPVTQAQWNAVMGNNPSQFSGDNLPVESVTWKDAISFCKKLNEKYHDQLPAGYEFSLPTEEQWEYACRAGTATALNNGQDLTTEGGRCPNLDEVAWYKRNSEGTTHPVKQKKPNAWGFYDMHGNVWEWCWTASGNESYRACRGGRYDSFAWICRSAYRNWCKLDRHDGLGLRLALVPVQ